MHAQFFENSIKTTFVEVKNSCYPLPVIIFLNKFLEQMMIFLKGNLFNLVRLDSAYFVKHGFVLILK